MSRSVSAREAESRLGAPIGWVKEHGDAVIVEHWGKPAAAIVSFAEYEEFRALREEAPPGGAGAAAAGKRAGARAQPGSHGGASAGAGRSLRARDGRCAGGTGQNPFRARCIAPMRALLDTNVPIGYLLLPVGPGAVNTSSKPRSRPAHTARRRAHAHQHRHQAVSGLTDRAARWRSIEGRITGSSGGRSSGQRRPARRRSGQEG